MYTNELIRILKTAADDVGVYILGAAGAIVVVMLIWGGLQYAQGNAEGGKKTIIAAVIGLAIIALSYLILAWSIDILHSRPLDL